MTDCKDCGGPIYFVQRWWTEPHVGYSNWVVCDEVAEENATQTWVEVEQDKFEPVFRHNCPGKPKPAKRSWLHDREMKPWGGENA